MNKKKKKTRIKHRKNQERVKKLLQVSMLKGKPKRIKTPIKVEAQDKPIVKKTTAKKVPVTKTTAKKTHPKKTATKKTAAKKAPTKKKTAKKD